MSNTAVLLPLEIWCLILEKLPNVISIVNLSLTCKAIGTPILSDLKYILKQNLNWEKIFIRAVKRNKIEFVIYLLERNSFNRNLTANKNLALRYASREGHLEIVRLLLESGADMSARNNLAFHWASRYGHLEVVRLLLEKGADVSDNVALYWASREGHIEVVKLLKLYESLQSRDE